MVAERIYLAGPDVFLPNPIRQAEAKKSLCHAHGFEGVFPLDSGLDLAGLAPRDAALKIAAANEALIRSCDHLIANMTPFRGPSMDVGTAYEMGVMAALSRPVHGYSNVNTAYKDRVDADGFGIEDFGLADNLMMLGAINATRGQFISIETSSEDRLTDLAAFEAILKMIRPR